MSKKSVEFENEIVKMVSEHIGKSIPHTLPRWMIDEGILPGATISSVANIGSESRENKTDVIIRLNKGTPIKISAKLRNADYFGNWYGHKRFLSEFGESAFENMTKASTRFANTWAKTAKSPYVGVSVCFGRRTGQTAEDFLNVFSPNDILSVAKGFGEGDSVANCMYISNKSVQTINQLIEHLEIISEKTIQKVTNSFKIAHRPINPLTEGTNRGKNVYTRFMPTNKLPQKRIITEAQELFKLGKFVSVKPDCLNHNHILDDLEKNYNIVIPRKGKPSSDI